MFIDNELASNLCRCNLENPYEFKVYELMLGKFIEMKYFFTILECNDSGIRRIAQGK